MQSLLDQEFVAQNVLVISNIWIRESVCSTKHNITDVTRATIINSSTLPQLKSS